MELVDELGCIRLGAFYCNESKQEYKIIHTQSTYEGTNPFEDMPWYSEDTIRRGDGVKRTFSRLELAERFIDVEEIKKEKITNGTTKRIPIRLNKQFTVEFKD
ncbi:hypothetical protein Phi46:1_gp33 [Cellulophaga phage phi46:1]|uniref:hypothetical protein n=1 Tax=Cellulophaga phage phi46:1 TaxID=1327974 RepID=UPI000351A42F|nr:hypothetical protein Phi46:1_gp33 [Cellulophaga phage phi46:1]AGO47844.1 hypothetical protein Phi46:1_gp33 [Cellulophaga phage phi46:1]